VAGMCRKPATGCTKILHERPLVTGADLEAREMVAPRYSAGQLVSVPSALCVNDTKKRLSRSTEIVLEDIATHA
jgi:hypothetical protein